MQKAQPLVHPRDLPPPKLNGSFQDHLCKSCWPHSPPRTLLSSHPGARHPGWGFISQFHIPSQASSSRCPNFPSCLCYSPPSCSCSLLYSCTLDSHADSHSCIPIPEPGGQWAAKRHTLGLWKRVPYFISGLPRGPFLPKVTFMFMHT